MTTENPPSTKQDCRKCRGLGYRQYVTAPDANVYVSPCYRKCSLCKGSGSTTKPTETRISA